MQIDNAILGGKLAAQIKARQAKLVQINDALAGHWLIKEVRAIDSVTGNELSMVLDVLDDATSQQVIASAIQIYQGQLAALQAQLDAL